MIGVDIVYIPRFQKVLEGDPGLRFKDRVFTKKELDSLQVKKGNSLIEALAGRFAAKEAVIKASKGDLNMGDLQRIEIIQSKDGWLSASVKKNDGSYVTFEVSISHDKDYAIAVALSYES
jgi:holo-[acyl-carrier protein] synthase